MEPRLYTYSQYAIVVVESSTNANPRLIEPAAVLVCISVRPFVNDPGQILEFIIN